MQGEMAGIELKLCYEPSFRSITDPSATDGVMGLLCVCSSKEGLASEYTNFRTPLVVEWDKALLPAEADQCYTIGTSYIRTEGEKPMPRLSAAADGVHLTRTPIRSMVRRTSGSLPT